MTPHFNTELYTDTQCRPLDAGWHIRLIDGPAPLGIAGRHIPASVPGSIQQDLETAGLLCATQAEEEPGWITQCAWEYSLDFPLRKPAASPIELVFMGLDTAAEVQLNGQPLSRARQQNPNWRDVGAHLFQGLNNLKVSVLPALS
jgi:beta-galactosidase/beta-glucuronidase